MSGALDKYKEGETRTVKVIGFRPWGIYVQMEDAASAEGLIHWTEIPEGLKEPWPPEKIKIGQELEVIVLSTRGKVALLSCKELADII